MSFPTYKESKEIHNREYVVRCLDETSGNVSRAAVLANKDRSDFYALLRRVGVVAADFRKKSK